MNRAAFLVVSSVGVPLLTTAANAQVSPLPSDAIWQDGAFLIVVGILVVAFVAALGILISKVIEVWRGNGRDPETRQLHFAAFTLSGLGLLFLASMAMFYWSPRDGNGSAQQIFDASKTIIPPIVTLVLGYYFGKRSAGD